MYKHFIMSSTNKTTVPIFSSKKRPLEDKTITNFVIRKVQKREPLEEVNENEIRLFLSNEYEHELVSNKLADITNSQPKPSKKRPRSPSFNENVIPAAKPKLVLINKSATRPMTSQTSYRALPDIIRNDLYDAQWIEKQERSFVSWLNYELLNHPEEADCNQITMVTDQQTNLRNYSMKLEYEHKRKLALMMYQDDMFAIIHLKLKESFTKNRIKMRNEVNIVADIGARKSITNLLFCYELRWLMLGLETVTGMAVGKSPIVNKEVISGFLDQHLFHDKQLDAQYQAQSNSLNNKEILDTIHRSILIKFFMIILFLDKAKTTELLGVDWCLFRKDAELKASRDILRVISNMFLLGEGDILRHLSFIGYSVSYSQTALEEFDFKVENLATDLRDGIRLVQLVEKVGKRSDLVEQLRFPAIAKSQQLHNVKVALSALENLGITMEGGIHGGIITPRDIVDGHREKTFVLLWKIILNWKIPKILDMCKLNQEIDLLRTEYKRMRKIALSTETVTISTSEHLSLLLTWCKTVCAFYDVPVQNFTNSFADGRALCYLLSYYHPSILPAKLIRNSGAYLGHFENTRLEDPFRDKVQKNTSIFMSNTEDLITEAQKMCKENFKLLQAKVKELGGVPLVLTYSHLSPLGIPDEKTAIAFVSYLCARLIDLSAEIRAARTIQVFYRLYRKRQLSRHRSYVFIFVQAACRGFLVRSQKNIWKQQNITATLLQSFFRGLRVRLEIRNRQTALVIIQSFLRGYLTRRIYTAHRALRGIQSSLRRILIQRQTNTMISSVKKIQIACREHLSRQIRQNFIISRHAAIVIQASYRRYIHRSKFLMIKSAVSILEEQRIAIVFGRECRQRYCELRWATVLCQRRARSKIQNEYARRRYLALKNMVLGVQSLFRAQKSQQWFIQSQAAIVIQKNVLSYIARRNFVSLQHASIWIQRQYRSNVLCKRIHREFLEIHHSITVIQQYWRAHQARKKAAQQYRSILSLVTGVQSLFRGNQTRCRIRQFHVQNNAAIIIQSFFRMLIGRQQFLLLKSVAICIQQRWRALLEGRSIRNNLAKCCRSVIQIQQWYRANVHRRIDRNAYIQFRRVIILLQSQIRAYRTRETVRYLRRLVCLQSTIRMHVRRREFLYLLQASRVIQLRWRAKQIGDLVRKNLTQQNIMTKNVQARIRGYQARARIRILVSEHCAFLRKWCTQSVKGLAIIRIQRAFRTHQLYRETKQRIDSIILIQRWWRSKLQRITFHKLRFIANYIQVKARKSYLQRTVAAVKIQKAWMALKIRRNFQRRWDAALQIQSFWRAYLVRRKQNSKYRAMRKKIREVNLRAEEHMKLSNRTTMALNILLSSTKLSEVLKACFHLDVVTRLSTICCLRLIDRDVIRIIFCLIKQSNRSKPHQEVLKYAMNILESLSLLPEALPYLFEATDGVNILMDSLQSYRDNEQILACVISVLLHLCAIPENVIVIRQRSNVVKRLRLIHDSFIRHGGKANQKSVMKSHISMSLAELIRILVVN